MGRFVALSILTIILIALLVILLFRVGLSILRFLIYVGLVLICIYLGYQGLIWLLDFFQINSGFYRTFNLTIKFILHNKTPNVLV